MGSRRPKLLKKSSPNSQNIEFFFGNWEIVFGFWVVSLWQVCLDKQKLHFPQNFLKLIIRGSSCGLSNRGEWAKETGNILFGEILSRFLFASPKFESSNVLFAGKLGVLAICLGMRIACKLSEGRSCGSKSMLIWNSKEFVASFFTICWVISSFKLSFLFWLAGGSWLWSASKVSEKHNFGEDGVGWNIRFGGYIAVDTLFEATTRTRFVPANGREPSSSFQVVIVLSTLPQRRAKLASEGIDTQEDCRDKEFPALCTKTSEESSEDEKTLPDPLLPLKLLLLWYFRKWKLLLDGFLSQKTCSSLTAFSDDLDDIFDNFDKLEEEELLSFLGDLGGFAALSIWRNFATKDR